MDQAPRNAQATPHGTVSLPGVHERTHLSQTADQSVAVLSVLEVLGLIAMPAMLIVIIVALLPVREGVGGDTEFLGHVPMSLRVAQALGEGHPLRELRELL